MLQLDAFFHIETYLRLCDQLRCLEAATFIKSGLPSAPSPVSKKSFYCWVPSMFAEALSSVLWCVNITLNTHLNGRGDLEQGTGEKLAD